MADVLTINGSAVNFAATTSVLESVRTLVRGGCPELSFNRLVGQLGSLPDSWSGQSCSLSLSGTTVFSGDVVGYVDLYPDTVGWTRQYRALGLLNRANYIPVTDSITLTDTSVWNLPGDDPLFLGSRAGQTVGAIVTAILQMSENAGPLSAAGIGNYTTTGSPPTYTLPSVTTTDLSALEVVPPWRVIVSGERILQSLESFVQTCHPNHFLHVDPSGNIRFLDQRTFTSNTLTLNGDDPRVGMPQLTRDLSDRYSQVLVRGNTLCVPVTIQTLPWPGSTLTDGGLQEDFAWGSYTNAEAKAAWSPSDYSQPNQYGTAQDAGTCTCSDTEHIVVTSSNTAETWAANYWGQGAGEAQGYVIVTADALASDVYQFYTARVVSNTALTAGGTSTLTLDRPLPVTTYTSYQLFGLDAGENIVGRRYKVTNSAIAAAMQLAFPYPVPYLYAGGASAEMVSTPIGTVMWGSSGTPPDYTTVSDGISLDPDNGLIYFAKPTQVCVGGLNTPVTWATNVQAFIPVAIGTLQAWAPTSTTYSGTLYTVEGIERTKIVTVSDWIDYSNQDNMNTFASELLDAIQDVVVEGTVPYYGLDATFLTPGQAISIAGNGYTTGWESLALPVVSVEIAFRCGPEGGTNYEMSLGVSNRRGLYSSGNFLRPSIQGVAFGGESFHGASAVMVGSDQALQSQAQFDQSNVQSRAGTAQQAASWQQNLAEHAPQSIESPAGQAEAPAGNPWAESQAGLNDLYGGARSGLADLYNAANTLPDPLGGD